MEANIEAKVTLVTSTGRNLVVCSDGTGNSAGKGRGTNVWRIYEALEHKDQLAIHDDGVGTSDNPVLKALGGAFGLGLASNVCQLYGWLARHYVQGDRIYLFGFSRGAFTVRCLAGVIARCGLPDRAKVQKAQKSLNSVVSEAWQAYKRTQRSFFGTDAPAEQLKSQLGLEVPIHFVGVWDTVDAYGFPIDEGKRALACLTQVIPPLPIARSFAFIRFKDEKPHKAIRHGFHALSLDDERHTFHPVLWDESEVTADEQEIEQVWFAGAHSDVGGGYARNSVAGLSLHWMMGKADKCDLRFKDHFRDVVKKEKNAAGPIHDSRSGVKAVYRYYPRDTESLQRQFNLTETRVHASVMERIERLGGAGAPQGLPSDFTVVDGHDTSRRPDAAAQSDLLKAHTDGRVLYLLLLLWTSAAASCLALAARGTWLEAPLSGLATFETLESFLSALPPLGKFLVLTFITNPWLLPALILSVGFWFYLRSRWKSRLELLTQRTWKFAAPPLPGTPSPRRSSARTVNKSNGSFLDLAISLGFAILFAILVTASLLTLIGASQLGLEAPPQESPEQESRLQDEGLSGGQARLNRSLT